MIAQLKRVVVGNPLSTADQPHQRLNKRTALAVFSSDALSSVAYATEEMLIHLAPAGALLFSQSVPISLAIVLLLIIVAISYRQTIAAYPNGGGSYIVAADNLGTMPGLIAGAALLVDYVLTVAVSIAAGVNAITSIKPALGPYTVELCLAAIVFITLINLRGVKESGAIFSLPTYVFIGLMLLLIGAGLADWLGGGLRPIEPPAGLLRGPHEQLFAPQGAEPLSLFLVLGAFASGCSAMTGVEAISNGVPAFKRPESRNARATLGAMAAVLAVMFLGTTWLAHLYGAQPRAVEGQLATETVLSQVGRGVFGAGSPLHYALQFGTAAILLLAANTSYADFPRLASLLARDRFLPRQFSSIGDRLVFSNGIILLALCSAALIILFGGVTSNLIPLYAVGVFLSFTLSQAGMVRRWLRLKTPGWRRSALLNGLGAIATGVVLVVIAASKFAEGAWIVIIIIPVLVGLFMAMNRHYCRLRDQLSFEGYRPPRPFQHTVLVLVSGVHRGVIPALSYATSIAPGNVRAVYIEFDPEDTEKVREKWAQWGGDVPLVVLESPYRSLVRPLMGYIEQVDAERDNDLISVVLPEFVPARWWHHLLHNQTALIIKGALLFRPGTVVIDVPYHLSA
ncbi:MAG TPA: APC family permease [Herpetosiphonaceae bacterium]